MFFRSKKEGATELAMAAPPRPDASISSVRITAHAVPRPGDGPGHAVAAPPLAANDPVRAFAKLVTVLMRTPETRGTSLADLEWLVLPAIRHKQMAVAESQPKDGQPGRPIGLLLWAQVSAEVDARLADDRAPIARLAPHEWASGEIAWVVLSIGRPEVVGGMLGELRKGALAERIVKVRAMGAEGAPAVEVFNFAHKGSLSRG